MLEYLVNLVKKKLFVVKKKLCVIKSKLLVVKKGQKEKKLDFKTGKYIYVVQCVISVQ